MEPITTTVAINAVVLYLAKKLADNKGISGFFNDFTEASVAWIKPVFLTEEGKEKEVIEKLQEKPDSAAKQNAVKAAIESELEDNPDAEQLLQEMAKVIQQNEPSLGMQNTNTITGDGNKVYQGNNHSQITDNSINQHHTGSGNNVAGNKIGTQTADKIYNIDRIDNAKF